MSIILLVIEIRTSHRSWVFCGGVLWGFFGCCYCCFVGVLGDVVVFL